VGAARYGLPVPPRRGPTTSSLGTDELTALAEALAAGRRPTVYLRDGVPSLGITAATAARVVSVAGSTVVVRPRGVGDDVPFEAGELAATAAGARLAAPVRSRVTRAPRSPAAPAPATQQLAALAAAAASGRQGSGRVVVTLHGCASEGWTVEVRRGSRRATRPTRVAAEAVARAVHALGDPATSEAVSGVVEQARRVAQARVAQLSTELEEARASLDALG